MSCIVRQIISFKGENFFIFDISSECKGFIVIFQFNYTFVIHCTYIVKILKIKKIILFTFFASKISLSMLFCLEMLLLHLENTIFVFVKDWSAKDFICL